MFNNLIKLSNGRTTTKILATLLVITLTFANFALLGSFMIESIAIDSVLGEQNSNTNSQNVKFNAYLDLADTSLREVSKDINSEELMLYVAVSVEGEGKLEKGVIDFSNSNFVLKDNKETYTRNINTITAGNKIVVQLPIVSRRDSNFNLNLLNMISKIKLTGEYIDKNGNITNIDATKEVKIEWNTENITEEQVNVSREVITNKICKVEGVNKRVVQLLINTNIQDNKAPIKSTKMEIENPVKGVEPEEVKVATYNTASTNGGDSIKFNNNQGSKWNYNVEENKTYIELTNEADNSGNISWQKNAIDELIVTYIYDEQTVINSISSNAKVILELYGKQDKIEKQNNLTLETVQEKGNIVNVQSSINQNIYKGNMYLGQDTEYKTKYDILVSYAMGDNIYIHDSGDKTDLENLSTYYKSTLINKAQAINVLGNEGTIKICKEDGSIISEILLAQENSDEYFTVNYSENVNNIAIETSKPINAGKIEIINVKAIKVLKLEKIDEATKLNVETKLYVKDSEKQDIEESTKQGTANLLEPTTSVDLELNKTSISNQVENELTITAVLNTNNNSNKLFDNPTINIELPKEITEATLLQDVSLLYEDELKIKSSEIKTSENGNKVISISLEGKQTKYDASANIVMYLKVNADKFMADKNAEIKTTCINGEEKVETLDNINIVSKRGILSKNSIIIGENKQETINNNIVTAVATDNSEIKIKSTIINNNGETIANTVLTGSVPQGAVLKSGVVTNLNNASIYYKNASQEWVDAVEDYSAVKEFKIEIGELEQANSFEIEYILKPTEEGLKEESLKSNVNIEYLLGEQSKEEQLAYVIETSQLAIEQLNEEQEGKIINTDKLSVEVIPTVAGKSAVDTTKITNGQVLRYKVKITNISNEVVNNLKIKVTKQNGVFYDIVQCGAIFDESRDENGNLIYPEGKPVYAYDEVKDMEYKEIELDNIQPGKISECEYLIVAYIGEGENKNTFNNNIIIEANGMDNIEVVDTKTITEAEIAVKLKYGFNEEVDVYSSSTMGVRIEVTNLLDKEIQNVNAKMRLPKELDCNIDNQSFLEENHLLTKDGNEINLLFKKLGANETQVVFVELITNDLSIEHTKTDVALSFAATINGAEKQYLSNDFRKTILQRKTHLITNLTSDKIDQILKDGDEITYTATIKNDGYVDSPILVDAYLQEELKLEEVKVIREDIAKDAEYTFSKNEVDSENNNYLSISENISVQETIKLVIKAKVNLEESRASKIANKLSIVVGLDNIFETEELINELMNENGIYDGEDNENDGKEVGDSEEPEQPENPSEPENPEEPEQPENPNEPENPEEPEQPENPNEPENPEQPEDKKYSISGYAWLDENKDGIRDSKEKTLEMLEVILLDGQGKQVQKAITSLTGSYKFNNLDKGEYMVAFKYDTQKYAVTKYKTENANITNDSDVISKTIELNNEKHTVAVTDILELNNSEVENIDIGLIENPEFDLSLSKYISKVIVMNNKGTTTYTYNEEELAKVEIAAKQLEGTTLLVEYDIVISNEGDISGFVTDIIDYIPNGLEFNAEMNTQWYLTKDNQLHFMELEPEEIKAGKTKTVKLTLIKTLTNDSAGVIENIAEISESVNIEAINDKDSVAGNKKFEEDDIGQASLIISIKTGSTGMYIGIVIISMAILGLGIYIINKKVLKEII